MTSTRGGGVSSFWCGCLPVLAVLQGSQRTTGSSSSEIQAGIVQAATARDQDVVDPNSMSTEANRGKMDSRPPSTAAAPFSGRTDAESRLVVKILKIPFKIC